MFIIFMVPESLPERKVTWGVPISWEQADPFAVSHWVFLCVSLERGGGPFFAVF